MSHITFWRPTPYHKTLQLPSSISNTVLDGLRYDESHGSIYVWCPYHMLGLGTQWYQMSAQDLSNPATLARHSTTVSTAYRALMKRVHPDEQSRASGAASDETAAMPSIAHWWSTAILPAPAAITAAHMTLQDHSALLELHAAMRPHDSALVRAVRPTSEANPPHCIMRRALSLPLPHRHHLYLPIAYSMRLRKQLN